MLAHTLAKRKDWGTVMIQSLQIYVSICSRKLDVNEDSTLYCIYCQQHCPLLFQAGFLISILTLSQTGPTQSSTAPPVVYHWANLLMFDVY